ncbi:unnamed protein product [Caenorhabditis nigoni]
MTHQMAKLRECPSNSQQASSNPWYGPRLEWNQEEGPPPPPAPIAEPLEAPQLDDNDVDAAIKEELGPGSWPRLEVTEEQKREAGQLMRHTAEMKRRSLAAKKKLKAIQEEMNRERAMEAKEQEERTQKKINLLFTLPLTKYDKQQQQRKVGAVKKASGIQDTLTINEALKDNGNDAKKVCENFGCVVREHKNARPKFKLRSQASIEAHEEKDAGYPEKAERMLRQGNNFRAWEGSSSRGSGIQPKEKTAQ